MHITQQTIVVNGISGGRGKPMMNKILYMCKWKVMDGLTKDK